MIFPSWKTFLHNPRAFLSAFDKFPMNVSGSARRQGVVNWLHPRLKNNFSNW